MIQKIAISKMAQTIMPIKQMMNTLRMASNPQAMLTEMVNSNPQVKQAMDYVNNNGGDAKAAFYQLAQENGVNPDEIINMLK